MMIVEIPVIMYLLENFSLILRIFILLTVEILFLTLIWFLFWLWNIFPISLGLGLGITSGVMSIIFFIISILTLRKEAPFD